MTVASVAARLVLALVFGVAAVTKLRDRGVSDGAVVFGVPPRMARPVAAALPFAELYVAALLVVPALSQWGVIGSVVLLAAFTVVVARALARGADVDCHCFGQLRPSRVTPLTLLRNVVLLGVAVLAAVR